MTQRRHSQHGFALLLTLVLLLIAAVVLAHVARQSTSAALEARERTESLQRGWAITSCRATLLPRAQGLVANQSDLNSQSPTGATQPRYIGTAPGERRVSCTLAGIDYDLVFSDEQTKYNPTFMSQLKVNDQELVGSFALRAALRELAGPGSGSDARTQASPAIKLRPMTALEAEGPEIKSSRRGKSAAGQYASYGQLFEAIGSEALVGSAQQPGAAAQITCWGDGRINLRLASPAVVRRVLGPVLGSEGVTQLLIARSNAPGLDPAKWLDAVASATPNQRGLAGALLSDQSRAQGLWVIAHGHTRSWHTLAVRVYTPIEVLEAQRDARLAESEGPEGLEPPPLPDPVQRYDYNW